MVAVCSRLTLVLVALYAMRVAIMVPLYLAGNIAALGVAKIVLGWPLWIAAVAVMGLLLVRGSRPRRSTRRPVADLTRRRRRALGPGSRRADALAGRRG